MGHPTARQATEFLGKSLGADNVCDVYFAVSEFSNFAGGLRQGSTAAPDDHRAKRQRIVDRFWSHVQKNPITDACWLWTANAVGVAQHGQFAVAHNVNRYAHRISWELHFGLIPVGLKVLHRCDVPRCVNPAHLFLGTQADNLADARAKGRHQGARRVFPRPTSRARVGHVAAEVAAAPRSPHASAVEVGQP